MDNDQRRKIYDVHRPHMVGAEPTSKPVIVGHRPTMPDPMLKEEGKQMEPAAPPAQMTAPTETVGGDITLPPVQLPKAQPELPTATSGGDLEVHLPAGKTYRGGRAKEWLLWFIILLLIAVAASGVYLALNRNKNNVPTSSGQSSTGNTPSQTNQTAVPVGFTAFKVPNTNVGFSYPTTWGTPSAVIDPGYSKRGGTNSSDGTHAYIISFANNKDVEVAITSSKYLPVARAGLYYDPLAWCLGTNDGKYYYETMHFTTDGGVDTPSNRVCDLGPLADVTKLPDNVIVQLKTKDAGGNVIGDLYTANLSDKDLPVLRVKDATMTNGDNIKKLLASVVN